MMGYSVRSVDYRYTVWLRWDGRKLQGDFTQKPVGEELYTHKGDTGADMNAFENKNLATEAAYAAVRKQMYDAAVKQWNANPRQEQSPRPPSSRYPKRGRTERARPQLYPVTHALPSKHLVSKPA